jgi:hypothetical protein
MSNKRNIIFFILPVQCSISSYVYIKHLLQNTSVFFGYLCVISKLRLVILGGNGGSSERK